MILAIDTSTGQAGIALLDGEDVRAEISWITAANHSTDLFAALDALWRLSGASLDEVTALTVASGPGSFSGIRVGLSVAKAIALARGIPLVAIPTLDAIAASAAPAERLWCLLPAGRGQVYAALYRGAGVDAQRIGDYRILGVEDATKGIEPGDAVAGEGLVLLRSHLGEAADVRLEPSPARLRRAAYLAELGRAYFADGGRDQTHEAEPLYLRRSAAEEKRDATGS